jgi:hypothetical protein
MKFRAHDTFFIRKGWLAKGMRNVVATPDVFTSRENNPMDVLGIGANMVKALRYWLVAVGLTKEGKGATGRFEQRLTQLGKNIYDNDPYFEELGTLWLLHYQLVKANDKSDKAEYKSKNTEATAWWYFFNEFKTSEFTREDFLNELNKYLRNSDEGEKPVRTIEDDFNCIIQTYVSRMKSNPEKVKPESNIDCPLGELGLIDIVGQEKGVGRQKIYRKSAPKKDMLHPLIMLAVILDQANGEKEIRISSIQKDNGNAGKVFNLDIISLTALLYKIELLGHIKVNRTAGLDVINIKTNLDYLGCVKAYYESING